ncbi:MAG: hypothetical protein AVDCRST_MAG66-1174, partial [uncultured Pseudonocardia sp.]
CDWRGSNTGISPISSIRVCRASPIWRARYSAGASGISGGT